jgi:2'-5' RNA ligase
MMGVDPAGAEKIAPDSAAPTGVTPTQNQQSNSATDAAPADSLWIGAVPAADLWEERLAPIRAAVAEILPGFAPDPDPHLTVLYLGAVASDVADLAVEEAQRAVKRLTADGSDLPAFNGSRVALMSPQADGRRAVALGGEAWGLYQVRDDLQAALGDLIAPDVRRFPTWRPHVTLGYVAGEITPAQRERLAVLVEAPIMLPIAQIAVRADRETPLAVLKTFDAATYQPPQGAQGNARKVLRWREEHGDDVKGMTSAGWIRAAQLARGEPISAEIVAKIAGFVRFREDYEAAAARIRAGESQPWEEAAYVAWLGWGGDTGIEWARGIQEARRAAGK